MVIHHHDTLVRRHVVGVLGIEATGGDAEKVFALDLSASPAEQNLVHVLLAIGANLAQEHFKLVHPAVEKLAVDGKVIGRAAQLGHIQISHLLRVRREVSEPRLSELLRVGKGREQEDQARKNQRSERPSPRVGAQAGQRDHIAAQHEIPSGPLPELDAVTAADARDSPKEFVSTASIPRSGRRFRTCLPVGGSERKDRPLRPGPDYTAKTLPKDTRARAPLRRAG